MPALPPSKSKSSWIDICKLLLGLLIVLFLGAILIILIVMPTKSSDDLRQSNERVAQMQLQSNEHLSKLERESNEQLARLQLKQQMEMEHQRQMLEDQRRRVDQNFSRLLRMEEREYAEKIREQDIEFTLEQKFKELERDENHREEDLRWRTATRLDDFIQETLSSSPPLNSVRLEHKVLALLRVLDSSQKSILVDFLYRMKLLQVRNPSDATAIAPLDLRGANFNHLDLSSMGPHREQSKCSSSKSHHWLCSLLDVLSTSYRQLALPMVTLINALLEGIDLNEANFSLSNMQNASFQKSRVVNADFMSSNLAYSNFRQANLVGSRFSWAAMPSSNFDGATLFRASLHHALIEKSRFEHADCNETNFQDSKLSHSSFRSADLFLAQMSNADLQHVDFHGARAIGANFSHANLSNSNFNGTIAHEALFRQAILRNVTFNLALLSGADFTQANLKDARITDGQLQSLLSIADAVLPNGSMGKNKNLVRHGQASCNETNGTISNWMVNGSLGIESHDNASSCAFRAGSVNATMQQRIDIRRYERMIQKHASSVYIEMEVHTDTNPPPVQMLVRYFDAHKNETIPQSKQTNPHRMMTRSFPLFRVIVGFHWDQTSIKVCLSTSVSTRHGWTRNNRSFYLGQRHC